MKTNIYKVGVLALTLLFAGCYDLNDLSHDPYKTLIPQHKFL